MLSTVLIVLLILAAIGALIMMGGSYDLSIGNLKGDLLCLLAGILLALLAIPFMAPLIEDVCDGARRTGARVGVAYYAELDTDMTSRGFATEAVTAAHHWLEHAHGTSHTMPRLRGIRASASATCTRRTAGAASRSASVRATRSTR